MIDGISEQDVEDIFSYARHGRIADVERLLDRGIPVNVRDVNGNVFSLFMFTFHFSLFYSLFTLISL